MRAIRPFVFASLAILAGAGLHQAEAQQRTTLVTATYQKGNIRINIDSDRVARLYWSPSYAGHLHLNAGTYARDIVRLAAATGLRGAESVQYRGGNPSPCSCLAASPSFMGKGKSHGYRVLACPLVVLPSGLAPPSTE